MIYKDVVNIIKDTLSRFKGVNYVRYSGDDLNNAQHNHKTLQAYIDDVSLLQFNLTTNITKVEFQIYILGFPEDTPESILDIQDECYNVAVNTLGYIDNCPDYKGIVRVYDYSLLTLSHYTAQNNAGVKLSVLLEMPVDLCNIWENFNDEPYPEDEDKEIELKPITLPKNGC